MSANPILRSTVAATVAALAFGFNAHADKTATTTGANSTPSSTMSSANTVSANTSDTAAANMAGSNDTARTKAGTKGSKPGASGATTDKGSIAFMEKAASHSMAEVELGKLAQERAADPQVKEFGERMARDHAKAGEELKPIADAKNVALPSAPDKAHHREYDKLAKKSGADFDRAYMKAMLDDHKKDVKEFQKEAQKGKDADVKGFASKSLPTLEEHLRLAQSTYDAVRAKK